MSKFSRDLYRKRLNAFLGRADDNAFLALAWSISALQSGQIDVASRNMRFRYDAVGAELGSKNNVPPWILETLINEFLRTPKARRIPQRTVKVLDCTHMDQMLHAQHLLRKLEDAEYGMVRDRISIFAEMRRMNHRQFEWQREPLSPARIYRCSYLYADGSADQFLKEKHGLGFHDLSLAGFALFSVLNSEIAIHGPQSLPEIGLTDDIYQKVLSIISQPIDQAKEQARSVKKHHQKTAYLPSVLRRFPIIKINDKSDLCLAPMPSLIVRRITSGVSMDFFGAPDNVVKEIANKFELYSQELISKILPNQVVVPEFSYGSKKRPRRTPDLLVSAAGKVKMVVECKSTGMTYDAKFSDDPATTVQKKIEDIGKGIFQIWRFFAHMRQGLVPNYECHLDAFGILLTLEDWFTMARQPISKMFEDAHKRCENTDEEILECDKRPVVMVWVEHLEYLQRVCDEDQFVRFMQAAHSDEYHGGSLPGLVDKLLPDAKSQNPYAFADEFGKMSWWQNLDSLDL